MTILSRTNEGTHLDLTRVASFYALTLTFAILVRLLVPWIGRAALPLTMMTPALSAAIMLGLVDRQSGWRMALRDVGLTRFGIKSWPLAIAAPATIMAAGLLVLRTVRMTSIATIDFGPAKVLDIVVSLSVGTLFALSEEIGWRGYMLPRLTGIGPMAAMLATGFLQGLWHLPLLMTTDLYHPGVDLRIAVPLFVTTLTLAGAFYGTLRLRTASTWPVAVAHGAVNVGWDISLRLTETKTLMTTEYLGGESGLIMIAGLTILTLIIARNRSWLQSKG